MSKYSTNYDLIDWSDFKPSVTVKTCKCGSGKGKGPMVMPDITPFVSPVSRSEITSRSSLREHNKRHGVFQVGDLKPHEFEAKPQYQMNEKSFDRAFNIALEKTGLK